MANLKSCSPIAYNLGMNLNFWIDDRVAATAQKKAQALGKSLDHMICEYLHTFVNDDPEKGIAEFNSLSGRGNSQGEKFDRDEIHERPERGRK